MNANVPTRIFADQEARICVSAARHRSAAGDARMRLYAWSSKKRRPVGCSTATGRAAARVSFAVMSAQEIATEILALSPAQRRQVRDFIAFLRQRPKRRGRFSQSEAASGHQTSHPPASEPAPDDAPKYSDIFGLWAGPEYDHITDGAEWVREQRRKNWGPGRYAHKRSEDDQ